MIETWSQGPADDNMPEAMLVDTLEKVRRHPWWLARSKFATAVLAKHGIVPPASLVEVGCGWGVNLDVLEARGFPIMGMDISRQILESIDRSGRKLVEADLNRDFPAGHPTFDALLALDVIEHLDDDRGAIQRMADLVRPGGIIVVSVPALPELFSEFDQIQGHRRRYLPKTLESAFASTGFTVKEIFWWGAWMVPVLRRMRAKNDTVKKTYSEYLRLPAWPLPLIMKLAYQYEAARALKGQLATGTSLFAVAVRKE